MGTAARHRSRIFVPA